ncbi:MAG: PilN domain-containing protein [Nitrospirae bacterium]|nr:PilN domain-containing protein [Nitrospirota bacterium]
MSAQLPSGIWLTALTEKSGMVNISGYTFSNADLVNYVQNLKSSKYLMDVSLLESKQVEVGGASLYQFKLTLRVKV